LGLALWCAKLGLLEQMAGYPIIRTGSQDFPEQIGGLRKVLVNVPLDRLGK